MAESAQLVEMSIDFLEIVAFAYAFIRVLLNFRIGLQYPIQIKIACSNCLRE